MKRKQIYSGELLVTPVYTYIVLTTRTIDVERLRKSETSQRQRKLDSRKWQPG